jgi:imidazolonepropionase-like amidohydrolase
MSVEPRRRAARILGLLVLAAAAATGHDLAPAPPAAGPILLRGGDLYTVAAGVLEGRDLLIVDGRIAAIGAGLAAPDGATVVDVTGRRVYPGLVALQSTLGLVEIGAVRATVDTAEIGDLTPEVAAHVAWNPDSELLPTVRANGIAVVQATPGGDGLLGGRSFVVRLDGWNREDAGLRATWGQQLRWPRPPRPWEDDDEGPRRPSGEDRIAALERAFDRAAAYDRARTADAKTPVDVRWEALRPVVAGREPLFVLAEGTAEIGAALELTGRRGLRMVLVGGAEAGDHAARLAERRIPVVLGTTHRLPYRADAPYDDPYTLASRLAAAGVEIAFAMPGASWDTRNLPFQAGTAIAFGLAPDAALRALTLAPAAIAGVDDRLGSLEVGKEATLVVSDGDLLDPLTQKVTHLYVRGREVDLDHRHRRLYEKYRQRLAPTR